MVLQGRIPDVILACIHHLRKHHPAATISVEVEKPGREGLQDLAALADVVFFSKSWAQVNNSVYMSHSRNTDQNQGNDYHSAEECLRTQAKLNPHA